ncbi:MerR family transcriptional regulator [Fundicoccus sp. Sow4_H7]|uniref:MerR family transcriptional regulator n=1 Tax=Fundicoccus sp. Sow4_H7 TaxID=3438784 RepID=UPI003F93C5B4
MNIQQISKEAGISKDAIRYYEKIGLLHPKRSDNNYRVFDQFDLERVKMIAVLQYAQFDLKEIKVIVNSIDLPPSDECNRQVAALFKAKNFELQKRIRDYQLILQMVGNFRLPESSEEFASEKEEYLLQTMHLISDVFAKIKGGEEWKSM